MTRTRRSTTVFRTIHPPEADLLADELSSCSRQVDAYRQETDRMITDLSGSWSGHQRDVFIASLSQIPSRLVFISEMFKNHSAAFRALQVTVEETVPVP